MRHDPQRGPEISLAQGLSMCRLALALAPRVAAWRRDGLPRADAGDRLNRHLLISSGETPGANPENTLAAALVAELVIAHAYGRG